MKYEHEVRVRNIYYLEPPRKGRKILHLSYIKVKDLGRGFLLQG